MPASDFDARGLPRAHPTVHRVARWVTVVATVWFAVAVGWELAGPLSSGHYAMIGARGMIAENMLTWHIWGPVREYTLDPPSSTLYYSNHPWGMFWVVAAFMKVLGRHALTFRLPAILMSAATPPLLYLAGRTAWGPAAGAVAAVTYALLPVTLGFGQVPGFEVPLAFGLAFATWTSLRFFQTWSWRWAGASALAFLWLCHVDWEAYVWGALCLIGLTVLALLVPRRFAWRIALRRYLAWVAAWAGIALVTLALYYWLFTSAGAVDNLFAQGRYRSNGNDLPLASVLEARRFWIESMFPPPVILAGKLAAVVVALRFAVLRRPAEWLTLAWLGTCVFQYVFFKNGADVHIYWPHPFSLYLALALAACASSFEWLVSRLRAVWRSSPAPAPALTGACLALLGPLVALPDTLRYFEYARETGGRLNDDGHLNLQNLDRHAVADWISERFEPRTVVLLHPSMKHDWALEWHLHRPTDQGSRPRAGDDLHRFFMADARFTATADLTQLAADHTVQVVGPFWIVDQLAAKGPVHVFSFDEREPSLWQRYVLQGHDPLRTIRADPFAEWELRTLLGQEAPAPQGAPVTRNQRRVALNVARAAGDHATADRLEGELLADFDRKVSVDYGDGTRLLGVRLDRGVAPRLVLAFRAAGPSAEDLQYDVRSLVDTDARWGFVAHDDKEKQVGTFFALGPRLWKDGHVYFYECEIRHRPGRERFYGYFVGRKAVPLPRSGPERTLLLTVE